MNASWFLRCGATALLAAGPAQATTIHLIDGDHSVAGSRADEAFRVAADFWGDMLTNDTVINIRIEFVRLPGGSMGVTSGRYLSCSIRAWEKAIARSRSRSAIDLAARLPALSGGAIRGLTLGTDAAGRNDMANPAPLRRDQAAARYLLLNSSVAKAVGLPLDDPDEIDATITLNKGYAFDFDPTDGVTLPGVDIVAVAIHEMGHALGFGSGVADFDEVAAPHGPGSATADGDFNDSARFNALDMFRYSAPGMLDFRPGAETYFSLDGGRSALFGARFASGAFNGDGDQAGHFKRGATPCTLSFGNMDAGRCGGQMGVVTAADLATFDAIGWNLRVDAMTFANLPTGEIVRRYRARHATMPPG